MRLIGYGFVRADAPARVGYLPLDDLTVVVGANDTGKSRLLEALGAHLAGTTATRSGLEAAAIFLELNDEELARLTGSDLTKEEIASIHRQFSLPRPNSVLGDEKVIAAVSASAIVAAVEPLRPYEDSFAFRCLQPKVIDELDLQMVGAATAQMHDGIIGQLGLASPPGQNAGLQIAPAPRPIVPVEPARVPAPPAPVVLPVPTEVLDQEVVAAVQSLVATLHVLSEFLEECDPADDGDEQGTALAWNLGLLLRDPGLVAKLEAGDAMLSVAEEDGPPHAVYVTDIARAVAATTAEVANELLPGFVRTDYDVFIEPAMPSYLAGRSLEIGLRHRETGARFALADAAEGYRLWVQLAILEGADSARIQEARLWLHVMAVISRSARFEEAADEMRARDEGEDDEGWEVALDDARAVLAASVRDLLSEYRAATHEGPGIERVPASSAVPRRVLQQVSALQSRMAHLRQRFYIIDEPERHLHPRLQREAARWLANMVRERRSQCLISTHAVPFMNLGSGTSYVTLRRGEGGSAFIDVLWPELLTALDEFAAELGLNRGELLATRNLILFVEGRADQKVLEALYLKRLYEAGIAVVPLHGAHHAKAQPRDSEILLRYTRAKVAVLLDDLWIDELLRLKSDDDFLKRSLRSRKETLRDMANLLVTGRRYGHDVEPFGLPGHDIFAMLDESILQNEYPKFPGHEAARAELAASGAAVPWKTFYEERYDIPQGVDTLYVRIADGMREEDRVPKQLDQLIDDIERYALLD